MDLLVIGDYIVFEQNNVPDELTLVRKGNRLSIMPIKKDIAEELLIKLNKD